MGANEKSFKKGHKASSGRPKGSPNKLTKTVREVLLETFNACQEDENLSMMALAKRDPTEFYKIAAKLIPTEIKADVAVTSTKLIIERKTSNLRLPSPESAEGNQ